MASEVLIGVSVSLVGCCCLGWCDLVRAEVRQARWCPINIRRGRGCRVRAMGSRMVGKVWVRVRDSYTNQDQW